MDFSTVILYGKKTMADLLKEIHSNSKDKEKELRGLINDLKPLIKTAGDAVIVVPLITKYLDASIKNDDALIKMIGVVQRATNAGVKNSDGEMQLSDEEKDQLLQNINELRIV